jgi:hypothetical protein
MSRAEREQAMYRGELTLDQCWPTCSETVNFGLEWIEADKFSGGGRQVRSD